MKPPVNGSNHHSRDGQDRHSNPEIDLKAGLAFTIKRERAALGISQGELAKRSGLHRTYISDLERGARNPSIESLARIAEALRLPLAKLFEDQTTPTK
jgi:DNA-binding XRE family transcriptional regulator